MKCFGDCRPPFHQARRRDQLLRKRGDVIWLDEIPFYIDKGSLKSIGRR
ncbi:Imm58 family immunity protein [Burkholderia multivorans]